MDNDGYVINLEILMKVWALLGLFLFCFGTDVAHSQEDAPIFGQLAVIDNAAPTAPVYKVAETTDAAIMKCSQENIATEFDTAESRLARVAKAPCKFAGVTTFRGRGDALSGDILKYDPEHENVYWEIPLRDNVRYGQMAIAYDFISAMGGGDKKSSLSKEQKNEVKTMAGTSFLILPLYGEKDVAGVYEATNGFGAKTNVVSLKGTRYSLAVNMGKQLMVGQSFRVATVPLPRDKAPDLVPNLDLQLYWVTAKPCDDCLTGGQADTGTLGGPTFQNPQDVRLLQHYVFAQLVAVRFVDRRNGKTYAISAGDKSFLAQSK
jgi:hypothetical protein